MRSQAPLWQVAGPSHWASPPCARSPHDSLCQMGQDRDWEWSSGWGRLAASVLASGCPGPASGWGGELRGSELEFKVGLIQAWLEANPRPQL